MTINAPNLWRLNTPGHEGWPRSARPDDPNKYFMVSADCHINEPANLWVERIEEKYRRRLPRVETDETGQRWQVSEGLRRVRVRESTFEGEDKERAEAGRDPEQRLRDHARDGIDAEIIFPNKGLFMWASSDAEFAMAMCRVYNDWVWELFAPYRHRMVPMACIATGDMAGSLAEIERAARRGFQGLCLPNKPIWGGHDVDQLNYNDPRFDRLWALIAETGLPITFHVGTGRDPRTSKGHGGAVINYVAHALVPSVEPLANLCASGVLERFPKIRFGLIECGIGWIPWALHAMDEAYLKHHMWVRPKLQGVPSDYFKAHGFASFQEDPMGLDLAEKYGLMDNFMWANDYPHHEGTWPHSAEAIEREMGGLTDAQRVRILGLNAARLFNLDVLAAKRITPAA